METNFSLRFSKTTPLIFTIIMCSFDKIVTHYLEDSSIFSTQMPENGTKVINSSIYDNYQNNMNSLFSEFNSVSSGSNPPIPGYFNTSVGQSPSKVYGSYLCRGDLKPKHCHDCTSRVISYLQYQFSESQLFYEEWFGFSDQCIIHFANHSKSNSDEQDFTIISGGSVPGRNPLPDSKEYNQTLLNSIQQLVQEAVIENSTIPNFATSVVRVSGESKSDGKIYALVQCSPDLSAMNCSRCLNLLHSQLPNPNQAGVGGVSIAYAASCMIKYDNQSFFDSHGAYSCSMTGYLPFYFLVVFLWISSLL